MLRTLSLICLLFLSNPAPASELLPMEVGREWNFGGPHSAKVTSLEHYLYGIRFPLMGGAVVYVKPNGDVYLWGICGGFDCAWDNRVVFRVEPEPQLLPGDADFVGSWETEYVTRSYGAYQMVVSRGRLRVNVSGTETVWAGGTEVEAVRVDFEYIRRSTIQYAATVWFKPGFGPVKAATHHRLDGLEVWEIVGPVLESFRASWGRVKQLFGG